MKDSSISCFRDSRVWQAGMDLVEYTYSITKDFPRHELYGGLGSQIQSAAVSTPSNITEGHTVGLAKQLYALRNALVKSLTPDPQPSIPECHV